MNKLRIVTFHIVIGDPAVCFLINKLGHLWLDMPTNLHVRLWELLAKKSADLLSFCISFYVYSWPALKISFVHLHSQFPNYTEIHTHQNIHTFFGFIRHETYPAYNDKIYIFSKYLSRQHSTESLISLVLKNTKATFIHIKHNSYFIFPINIQQAHFSEFKL